MALHRVLPTRATFLGFAALVFAVTAGAQTLKSWDDQVSGTGRFKLVSDFDGLAVLDKETGVLWAKTTDGTQSSWQGARAVCAVKVLADRMAWRLPTIFELASLIDPSHSNPALPAGHPFLGVNNGIDYWSGTTDAANGAQAWSISFGGGSVFSETKTNSGNGVWCVRGPLGSPTVY